MEPVFANAERKTAAIVPLNMELRIVINALQRSHTAGGNGVGVVFHLNEPDATSLGILLPEKVQPFLLYCHLVSSYIIMLWSQVAFSSSWWSCATASKMTGSFLKLSSFW